MKEAISKYTALEVLHVVGPEGRSRREAPDAATPPGWTAEPLRERAWGPGAPTTGVRGKRQPGRLPAGRGVHGEVTVACAYGAVTT